MATELLFEAYKKYIEPLLDFGWIRLNEQGFLVEREHGNILHYINDHYSGKPDEVPCTYPVLPLSDEHYLQIKENPEWELFNPFASIKHMTLVVLEFKRGLINYHLSEDASQLDLDQQEDLIRFYYNEQGDDYIVGFCNVEQEDNPKVLYEYTAKDFISAMWGLCITAYNDLDRKHDDYFYDIEKAWRKVSRLINKWDEERRKIIIQTKSDHQQDYGFQNMDLSDMANTKINEYPSSYFIAPEEQDAFLFSLFGPHELLPAILNEGESAPPIERKERVWTFPDFASDETIFKQNTKASRKRGKKSQEITPESVIPQEYQGEVLQAEIVPNNLLVALPPAIIEKAGEEVETKDAVPFEEPPPPPPVKPKLSIKAPSPAAPPPLTPFEHPWGFPQYQQPPQFGFGNNQMLPQNVPTDINQIDFESIERPDPFASYRR
jgi:hypothetical protein